MKKLFVVSFLCLLFAEIINAQGYTPQVGDTILFYPLSQKAKTLAMGYDCFYDATKIKKKERTTLYDDCYVNQTTVSNVSYKFKDDYRYKCAENGLTPFSEIEGHTFRVSKMERYIHKNKKENEVFLLFLTRLNDSSEIILRIPFFEEESNSITNNLISRKLDTKITYINLPCIPVGYMEDILKKFKEKELYFRWQYKNSDYNYDIFRTKEYRLKNIFKSINGIPFHASNLGICIDVKFVECDISPFAHPFMICTYKKSENEKVIVNIPLTFIAGNTSFFNSTKSSNFLFECFFTTKEKVLSNMFSTKNCIWVVKKFSGEDVYYGEKERYNYDGEKYNAENNRRIIDGSLYVLKEGNYKCLRFDIYKKPWESEEIYAILEDSSKIQFRVPATKIYSGLEATNRKEHYCLDFQDYFMLTGEAYAIKEEKRLLALQKEKEEKERYALWVKKYGVIYATYINELSEFDREKFERLSSKYGKSNAKMMIEKKVKLGWNTEMCKESWGYPDDINRTTGIWGTHEQWVYGDIYCSCLYFENGILTTIQN